MVYVPKKNRKPRPSDGRKRVTLQLSDEEYEKLKLEVSGTNSMSEHIRAKLFAGGIHTHGRLKEIGALHHLGKILIVIMDKGEVGPLRLDPTLKKIRDRIDRLARSS